jgi:hypothetical protein
MIFLLAIIVVIIILIIHTRYVNNSISYFIIKPYQTSDIIPPLNLLESYNYPVCKSECLSVKDSSNLIKNSKYFLPDDRCFQTTQTSVLSSILDGILNKTIDYTTIPMISCSLTSDTRLSQYNFYDPLIWLNAASLNLKQGDKVVNWNSKSPGIINGTINFGYGSSYNIENGIPFVRTTTHSITLPTFTVNILTGITVALCYRPDKNTYRSMFGLGVSKYGYPSIRLRVNGIGYGLNINYTELDSGVFATPNTYPINFNNWQYVILRMSKTIVDMYGVSSNNIIRLAWSVNPVQLMTNFTATYNFINDPGTPTVGTFDLRDFIYYDRLLSMSEVEQLKTNFKNKYGMA